MTSDWIGDDDQLAGALGDAIRTTGPIPAEVRAAAKAAFEFRSADKHLAQLVYDSLQDEALAAFRSHALAVRTLVFKYGELRLDVEIARGSVTGQVLPALRGKIFIVDAAGRRAEAWLDEFGRFSVNVALPSAAQVHFQVEPHGRRAFATEWLRPEK